MKYALGRKVMLINSHSDYFKEQHTLLTATEPSEKMLGTTLLPTEFSPDLDRFCFLLFFCFRNETKQQENSC